MLGRPKFKREDMVTFEVELNGELWKIDGVIYIVDAYGTSDQNEEPSYDIEAFYNGEVMLFKHIRESQVSERNNQ